MMNWSGINQSLESHCINWVKHGANRTSMLVEFCFPGVTEAQPHVQVQNKAAIVSKCLAVLMSGVWTELVC